MERLRLHRHPIDELTSALSQPDIAAEVLDLLRKRLSEATFRGLVKAVEREAAQALEERGHVHS